MSEIAKTGYYGTPLLNEPVWEWAIPAYFYVGGVAGVCATFGALLEWADACGNRDVAQRCREIAVGGSVVSAALLIHDLGKPSRFLYMLRVFRPTSPMSVGSWILAGFGGAATAALLPESLLPRWASRIAQIKSGLLGLPLATYTAVLVGNTAVPVWKASRNRLPFLFAGSAMAGAGSLLELSMREPHLPVRMLTIAGGAAELFSASVVEALSGPDLKTGAAGAMWNAARLCSAVSLGLSAWPGTSRGRRIASGVLGTLASIGFRFAVMQAGRASARNPFATFEQQRPSPRRISGAEPSPPAELPAPVQP